jgi:hypothetical protein
MAHLGHIHFAQVIAPERRYHSRPGRRGHLLRRQARRAGR